MCRRFLLVLLAIITFACSGCLGGGNELSIDESGEVHSRFTLVGMDFMREEIEKQRQELIRTHSELLALQQQNRRLATAGAMSAAEGAEEATKRINALIAQVDRAIGALKR